MLSLSDEKTARKLPWADARVKARKRNNGRERTLGSESETALAPGLDLIHNLISLADQGFLGVAVIGIDTDADGNTEATDLAVHQHRLAEGIKYFLSNHRHRFPGMNIMENDNKLIATQPGDGIGTTHRGKEPPGHLFQHMIAGFMAQGVINHLEIVEIQKEQGQFMAMPFSDGYTALQTVREEMAVDQAGEWVVMGKEFDPRLTPLFLKGQRIERGKSFDDLEILGV